MKPDLSFDRITELLNKFQSTPQKATTPAQFSGPVGALTRQISGLPSETPEEKAKLLGALSCLDPNAKRGNGSLFSQDGSPSDDYWLGTVWAIRALGWGSGHDIAREWSERITRRDFCLKEFNEHWNRYDPSHAHPVSIGSLYKRATANGWDGTSRVATPAGVVHRFRLIGSEEIQALAPMRWRLKGIFPETGVAAIFGPSASGKSFLAQELATSIATGGSWFNIKTVESNVVYIMLEGEAGLKNRISAWEKARARATPERLKFIVQPMQITSPIDLDDLLAVLPRNGVIFIDTLNRSAPTADENSSKDMGAILEGVKRLSRETNSLVVLVHHTGKDSSRGLRGHSSLFAALDGAIEVTRDLSGRAWTVAKSKDGEDGRTVKFKLSVHQLGKDSDGEEITSCTVEPDFSGLFQATTPKAPSGKRQASALKDIKRELQGSTTRGKCNSGANTACLKMEDAITLIAKTLTTIEPNKRSNRARGVIDSLLMNGFIRSGLEGDEGWLWLE